MKQIKSVTQEIKNKPELNIDENNNEKNQIRSFDDLLSTCIKKKEIKLKYELEKNVNLVRFEKKRIDISFNDNLDKNFIKDLSLKLFEWTNERWIITLTKVKGDISIKEKEINIKNELLKNAKESKLFKNVLEKFDDAILEDIKNKKDDKN